MTVGGKGSDGPRRQGKHETRLQRWMVANGVRPLDFATASGMSRQWLTKLRWTKEGEANIGLRTMKLALKRARQLRGNHVQMSDLFDLEPIGDTTPEH